MAINCPEHYQDKFEYCNHCPRYCDDCDGIAERTYVEDEESLYKYYPDYNWNKK